MATKSAAKKAASNQAITHVDVRMYRLGTGDCFILKFFAGAKEKGNMMIDCGCWQGSKKALTPYIEDLKEYVGNKVDVLVVTHEHKDHVHGFDACEELFTDGEFKVGEVWMGWTEEDGEPKVEAWKKEYGQKKKALAAAADRMRNVWNSKTAAAMAANSYKGQEILAARQHFAHALDGFVDLHMALNAASSYAGPLKGMAVVKDQLAKDGNGKSKIRCFGPGDVIEHPKFKGVKFYVLGPPLAWKSVETESGAKGETYDHNKEIIKSGAFAAAVNHLADAQKPDSLLPFSQHFEATQSKDLCNTRAAYDAPDEDWRRIDNDWLMSAGSLALRMNSLTNNLSLAMAIEFTKSKRVMLFPGDAEYGSWASWHQIDWGDKKGENGKHFTEDLLNRTVFYKVAHHLSHNGTARRLGLDMMKDEDLAAMATLDYGNISGGWTGTMPNMGIIRDLLKRSKGRLMVMRMNDDMLGDRKKKTPLSKMITRARSAMSEAEADAFAKAHPSPKDNHLFLDYRLKA